MVAISSAVTKVEVELREVANVMLDPVIVLISVIVGEVITVGAIVIADLTFAVDVSVVSIVTVLMRLMKAMLGDSCKERML